MQKQNFPKIIIALLLALCLPAGAARAGLGAVRDSIKEELAEIGENLKEIPDKVNSMMPRPDFKLLVKQAGPAVVNISTERTTVTRQSPFFFGPDLFRGHPFFDDDDMNEFFGPWGGRSQPQQKRRQSSMGSGFIISPDGYLVTNNHVVEGAEIIRVNFKGATDKDDAYEAEVIGADKETDLALLKIKTSKDLPYISFGDSDALEVGEWVVAIGNPFGLDNTVTAGILSAKFRNIGSNTLVRFLQTDASINPGNSGGPLLNMDGEVIGINTAIAAQGQGIGFAIPSTLAGKIIDDLKANRKVSRGWLGVSIQNIDASTAKALGLPKTSGALIGGLIAGQPAEKAGIEPGDVILEINGKEIANADELLRTIADMKPQDTVNITLWRDGKTLDKKITLAERGSETSGPGDEAPIIEKNTNPLGLQLRPLNAQEAARLRLPANEGGLLILQVDPDKLAAKAGIQRGDVIMAVGRIYVKDVETFNRQVRSISEKQGAVMLQMNRNGQRFIRSIDLSEK
ncbi:MAG: Do family serine endopeptidase [Deltaproteobacteria bacterium]|jgi:serine protease Do|nr:Do family serine endopeptidase [Deltaproteobacteria bacterium]